MGLCLRTSKRSPLLQTPPSSSTSSSSSRTWQSLAVPAAAELLLALLSFLTGTDTDTGTRCHGQARRTRAAPLREARGPKGTGPPCAWRGAQRAARTPGARQGPRACLRPGPAALTLSHVVLARLGPARLDSTSLGAAPWSAERSGALTRPGLVPFAATAAMRLRLCEPRDSGCALRRSPGRPTLPTLRTPLGPQRGEHGEHGDGHPGGTV